MKEFNINSYIAVRLTDVGRAELRRKHEKLRESFPELEDYIPPKEDEDGWCKFQGWVLMNTFGHLMTMGTNLPFETYVKVDVREKNNG